MLHFCTLFDINYLNRGLLLHKSLLEQCNNFKLYILCLDNDVYQFLQSKKEKNIIPILLSELEINMPELSTAKQNRKPIEYYFTLSPCLPLYILNKYPEVDAITSLDADIYFFSSPEVIYQDLDKYSILITPHRFIKKLSHLNTYGKYNVSFQVFKRDEIGLKCLNEWKDKCIEWCYDYAEGGRFADQKYLDNWVTDYGKVKEIDNVGAGLAPWNISDFHVKSNGTTIFVNGKPLIYYHFHALRFLRPNIVSCGTGKYNKTKPNKKIYVPYIKELMSLDENKKATAKQTNREEIKTSWKDIRMYRDLLFICNNKFFIHPWITPNF